MANRLSTSYRPLAILVAGALLWSLCFVQGGVAQGRRTSGWTGTLAEGTTIPVRTTEDISTSKSDGRVYRGVVDEHVLDRRGNIAIPRGSDVEMVIRETADDELALDLDSVVINGQRYGLETEETVIQSERKSGIGANKRTGKYVGGGAVIGAIIGAIAGGGKGAAIGAGAGAAAGAGAQVLTRGSRVNVPAESLLTFQLDGPMRAPIRDDGFMRDGNHYHRGYGYDGDQYSSGQYRERGTIRIGGDNRVRWEASDDARVFVQTDNQPFQLFAQGRSGVQDAPWIAQGHRYLFVLRDRNGNELARDQVDLRVPSRNDRFRPYR